MSKAIANLPIRRIQSSLYFAMDRMQLLGLMKRSQSLELRSVVKSIGLSEDGTIKLNQKEGEHAFS
jgi:hypothetical protein